MWYSQDEAEVVLEMRMVVRMVRMTVGMMVRLGYGQWGSPGGIIIIIMEICKAPTLWLKALNKHSIKHIMYILSLIHI